MRTCDVYKSMFFKMDANFKTSVKARKLSGSTVMCRYVNKKNFDVASMNSLCLMSRSMGSHDNIYHMGLHCI